MPDRATRAPARVHVGVDLAWGERATSGVVVAVDGRVTASATVVQDDDIVSLVPDGPVVVAFDAPIVVPNETGRRGCDAAVSRCFAAHHAGAYPANRSIPWLAAPRAGRLADRLGCTVGPVDPAGRRPEREAIEVYPHAATITLFGLDRVLPYKRRSGRDLATRRAALTRLCGLLEGLAGHRVPTDVTSGPRWTRLRAAVAGATTLAALDRVEDEVDAHLCVHVAALWDRDPDGCDVAGTAAAGAIVVPAHPRTSACFAGGAS
jgi:predicted RNase H-like nuclease